MEKYIKAAKMADEILASIASSSVAATLILKWSDKDLGPNPLVTAASLEARNIVFGWGR